jgi:hypothetical protein
MKSLVDHIGSNWVKWLLTLAVTILMGFNTYIVNKVDAMQLANKDYVLKEDHNREINNLRGDIQYVGKKVDLLLTKNLIPIPDRTE